MGSVTYETVHSREDYGRDGIEIGINSSTARVLAFPKNDGTTDGTGLLVEK